MTTFTRQSVRELMLDEFGLGRRGTNTGTSTTTITDLLNFSGPTAAKDIEVGSEVMITSGTGAPADEFARLNSKPSRSTGVMTLDRTLTAALANNDTFEVLYPGITFDTGPHSIHQSINDALAGPSIPWELRQVPITLVPDGDMLKAGTTDWSESNVTLAKVAASFPLGLRTMEVTATAANGEAKTGDIQVESGASYFFEATGLAPDLTQNPSDAILVLFDQSNSAEITLTNFEILITGSADDRIGHPVILMNAAVTMPSGCQLVLVQLRTVTNTNVTAWANVILRKNSAREFTIQDRPARILDLGRLLATKVDRWGERGDRWEEIPAKPVQVDSGIWQYHTDVNLGGRSVWYEEYIEPVALTADSDTTNVNKRALAAIAAERVLRPLARSKMWRDRYAFAASVAASVRLNFDSRRTVLDQRTRTYPIARV